VVLRVADLPAGARAVLVVESSDAGVVRTADRRCAFATARATCQIDGSDLSPVALEVVAPLGTQVVATLTAASDPDPGNNTWRATLG
jgi:hypothetical protein